MAEQENISEQQPETDAGQGVNKETMDSAIKQAMADMDKKYKSMIDGLNRRNSELEKQLETEKQEHMSEKEKSEYQFKRQQQELEARERALQQAQLDMMITNGLAGAKLSTNLRKLMSTPANEESLGEWVTQFQALVKAEADARVNAALVGQKSAPQSGNGAATKPAFDLENMTKEQASKLSEEDIQKLIASVGR